ncbi:ATP-binding protein [Methanoregula sp.]|uniref:ATP-binding protein n=1 Tax=Methanoregula sp. TaxID=2052170 RepID=UPI002C3B10CE|nr:DUF87 domain-containing protein [Methanoregula sp.]HVP96752.1 DUF87 domain-containing protein [Methanoregula sp.]
MKIEGKNIQKNSLALLEEFLKKEQEKENAGEYKTWRFVGYVLDISYDKTTIVTCDAFKKSVGGIPRNSLLIMVPSEFAEKIPLHFTLLRVLDSAPTPLSKEVQETYFELQKRSMPDLDVFTLSELQWGGLETEVLGMFYPDPKNVQAIEFSGDINNYVSAINYRVYSPDNIILDTIVNSLVPKDNQFPIGKLRLTECQFPLEEAKLPNVKVMVSPRDFLGTRTAMFGKTRLGKSNTIKIIAQSIIETTETTKNVGQIIFDINGEYANDNIQDNNFSLKSAYKDRCEVFSFRPRPNIGAHVLKINFYEHTERSHSILIDLLNIDQRNSVYIKGFTSTDIPSIESLGTITDYGDKVRAQRRILIYWAILAEAGFAANEESLKRKLHKINRNANSTFDPCLRNELRQALYAPNQPPEINSLNSLKTEFKKVQDFIRRSPGSPFLNSATPPQPGNDPEPIFDEGDKALLKFLNPGSAAGPRMIYPYHDYHDTDAKNIFTQILSFIDEGKTVILDLGNANPMMRVYYSDELSNEIFKHQMGKFTENTLKEDQFIQVYFEEAHNLFPQKDDVTTIYSRLAKEGAKFHIGMVYSTQSPSTINKDLLAQTENFFIAHISARNEVKALANLNVAYENIQEDILRAKTPGYLRILTRSNRFVIPVQAEKFSIPEPTKSGGK